MYEENFHSPNGPDLDMDDLHGDSLGHGMMDHSPNLKKKSKADGTPNRFKSKHDGNVVGH